MNRLRIEDAPTLPDADWTPFPGGELEGVRPRALCQACRDRARNAGTAAGSRGALCFQCYRLDLDRQRALKAAAELDTASEARFQSLLPFEPVNTARLARLKVERQAAKAASRIGAGAYIEKRRRAQIEARHALAAIFRGLEKRQLAGSIDRPAYRAGVDAATHAAELQLPASWLPFVVAQ